MQRSGTAINPKFKRFTESLERSRVLLHLRDSRMHQIRTVHKSLVSKKRARSHQASGDLVYLHVHVYVCVHAESFLNLVSSIIKNCEVIRCPHKEM